MRGWLAANLFFFGIVAMTAAILFVGAFTLRHFGVTPDTERQIVGWLAVFAVFATGWTARAVLKRIERRR